MMVSHVISQWYSRTDEIQIPISCHPELDFRARGSRIIPNVSRFFCCNSYQINRISTVSTWDALHSSLFSIHVLIPLMLCMSVRPSPSMQYVWSELVFGMEEVGASPSSRPNDFT